MHSPDLPVPVEVNDLDCVVTHSEVSGADALESEVESDVCAE